MVRLVLLWALVVAAPESAAARAQRHFEAQEWAQAVEALIEAYAEDPDPAYLYARAQAERHRGECKVAIELYRRFLEHDPTPQQRADTERHIRLCEERLFEERVRGEPTPAPAAAPQPEPDKPPPRPRPRTRRDPVAPALLGTGLAALAAGLTVAVLGDASRRRAPQAATEGEYEDDGRRGTTLLGTGIALATVGAALVAGAIVRFAVKRRKPPTSAARLGSRF